jgi:hypothetical protein
MIYTSNKPQAKRITQWPCKSSTESTNFKKELLSDPGEALLSPPILKKESVSGPSGALLSHYFFLLIKATSNKPAACCLSIFFYLKKQQATSQQRAHLLTLDMLSIRLYKISN